MQRRAAARVYLLDRAQVERPEVIIIVRFDFVLQTYPCVGFDATGDELVDVTQDVFAITIVLDDPDVGVTIVRGLEHACEEIGAHGSTRSPVG